MTNSAHDCMHARSIQHPDPGYVCRHTVEPGLEIRNLAQQWTQGRHLLSNERGNMFCAPAAVAAHWCALNRILLLFRTSKQCMWFHAGSSLLYCSTATDIVCATKADGKNFYSAFCTGWIELNIEVIQIKKVIIGWAKQLVVDRGWVISVYFLVCSLGSWCGMWWEILDRPAGKKERGDGWYWQHKVSIAFSSC